MKKKIIALLICILLTGCGKSDTTSSNTTAPSSSTTTTTPTQSEDADVANSLDKIFSSPTTVPNDVTKNWRLARTYKEIDIVDYATDYYNTFFASDDEIHAIVNFTLNTTTKISVLVDGVLDVTVYEYVENEEFDAATLFSGMLLKEYLIYTNNGTIEDISSNT